MPTLAARKAPNWTSAAGALEGILRFLEAPLPRYAVMGLTGLAWHFRLAEEGGVAALPSGPNLLDWPRLIARYDRTGYRWERFSGDASARAEALAWARKRLDAGVPLLGFDFHLHEYGVVYGYDAEREGFLVDDSVSPQVGAFAAWDSWPSPATDTIELLAPAGPSPADPAEAVIASIHDAIDDLESPDDGSAGTAGLRRWADVFESDMEVDRVGNAYTLQVLQAARMDGADYLRSLVDLFEDVAEPLQEAERHVRDELQALAPLITLFPFPAGGHGNVANAGLRQAAANALRRAAVAEAAAVEGLRAAERELRTGA